MAISDFYAMHSNHQTRLVLHTRASKDLVSTATAVMDLLKNVEVHAILGPQIADAAPLVIELGEKANVPVISFFPTSPTLSPIRNPYFIRAAQDDSIHDKAIASILQSFGWNEVVFVYEDTAYGNGMISSLVNSLHEHDIRVAYMSAILPSAEDFQISRELKMLMTRKNRVFVVHMTSSLGSRFFAVADKAGMMSEGYVWLITAALSNSLKAMNSEIVDSMEGVLGIRSHVPESKDLKSFNIRWKRNLHLMNPNSSVTELNIFGLWAYDTIWALAMAVERIGVTDFASVGSSRIGPRLVKEITNVKFKGLSGEFHLVNGRLKSSALEIFNVIGKGERVVGYWTPDKRLSRRLYSSSSSNELRRIIWAGDSTLTPQGSAISKLRIGIPVKVGFKEFVDMKRNVHLNETAYFGFSIDVFRAALKVLDVKNISYEFFPFMNDKGEMNGTYDDMLHQIGKEYDAVVGDTTIVANRTYYVDFTMPYSEAGVTMLVPIKHGIQRNMWIFLHPWSWDLWLAVIASFIFMGLVIRIMEQPTVNTAFTGPPNRQLGMTLWWPFAALALPERGLVVKDWSRFVLVIWIGLAVILMQIYTASLSSMLIVDQLQPSVVSVNKLRTEGYRVGHQNGSFVKDFLLNELKLSESQLIPYRTVKEYYKALSKGHKNEGVAAIFAEIPYIRVFLNKYGSKYTMAGPIYRTSGFGFAFPKGSPLVSYFSRAILKVREEGKTMDKLEEKYFGQKITSLGVAPPITPGDSRMLHASSFSGLFIIVGIATLLALVISESYIWSKPVALAKQFIIRYLSSKPSNGAELATVQSTAQVHAIENSIELEDLVGNSNQNSESISNVT
ncbi:hypothetical protein Dsin_013141 [Dipteronia sinensis]|uniref:Glutamate receptor n=1 Tax=Dipteronia sinensis TaxID=43782 RepID=A0AAE0E8P7_9ROSI|nr:hypothetical protein Dsin_013141 [Dipteronia sinensis]